jgi:hypothetical protein
MKSPYMIEKAIKELEEKIDEAYILIEYYRRIINSKKKQLHAKTRQTESKVRNNK